MSKRAAAIEVAFTCEGPCGKPTSAAKDSALELLRICPACQKSRYARGIALRRAAEAQEAKRG